MAKRQEFAAHWWSRRWLEVLESFGWSNRLQRGRNYARQGLVLEVNVEPGLIMARVQGSSKVPYKVEIRLAELEAEVWAAASQEMGQRAAFCATLLADGMPDNIEEAFPPKHPLLPRRASEFHMDCSCPDFANPCKHLAAVFYVLAESFDQDPFLIFVLRGRTRQQILSSMPQLAEQSVVGEELEAYPLDLERFWAEPPDLPPLPPEPRVECSLLRRLGSPFPWCDDEELLKVWLPIYRQLGQTEK